MNYMFSGASAFNQPIGNWDTGNVTNMNGMFSGASAFDQNLGTWNVDALTTAQSMFADVTLSTANYDALLNGWDAQALQPNVTFSGGNSQYCTGEAARAHMISSDGWTITDGGSGCSDQPLAGRLTSVFSGNLITYTFVVTNISSAPQTVVISGSLPADTAFVSVTGGTHNPTGGDYGTGYVYINDVTLAVGQSRTLVWSVRPLLMVGDIVTQGHAAGPHAQLTETVQNRVYRTLLMLIFKNAQFAP